MRPTALDDDQLELQRVARRLFESGGSLEAIAGVEWFGILVESELGGSGARFADMLVIVSEAGRVAFAGPFVPTAVDAASVLAAAGDSDTARSLRRAVCSGQSFMTTALADDGGACDPLSITTQARPTDAGFVITGRKQLVREADGVSHILVAARTSGTQGDIAGISLFDVDPATTGIRIEPLQTVGPRRVANLSFDGALVPATRLVGAVDTAGPAVREALSRSALAEAAYALGGAERAVELAIAHARDREQFGRPIGDYQAVQHHCVDALSDVHAIRCIVGRAADAVDEGALDRHRLASVAKAWAGDAFIRVTQHAHRVMGAFGFADEGPLGSLTATAQVSRVLFGTPTAHRAGAVASATFDGTRWSDEPN